MKLSMVAAIGVFVPLLAQVTIADEPKSAQDCLDNFYRISIRVSESFACYGQAKLLQSDSKYGTIETDVEWFEARVSIKTLEESAYSEVLNSNQFLPNGGLWEKTLVVHSDRFRGLGNRNVILRKEDPRNDKNGKPAGFAKRLQPIPAVFNVTLLPNVGTTAFQYDDNQKHLASFISENLQLLNEKKVDGDIVGIFASKYHNWQITFAKDFGFMPVLVKGFFADESVKRSLQSDETELFRNPACTIKTKWQKVDGKQIVFVPVRVLNIQHKFNSYSMSKSSAESEFIASWKVGEIPVDELVADRIEAFARRAGPLFKIRDELELELNLPKNPK